MSVDRCQFPEVSKSLLHYLLTAHNQRCRTRFSRLSALSLAVVLGCGIAQAAVFTSDATIAAGDVTYDGTDIVVDGCEVTLEGSHTFGSVQLQNAARVNLAGDGVLGVTGSLGLSSASTLLVQSVNRGDQVGGLWQGRGATLQAGSVQVSADSAISADAQGYLSSKGPGADPDNGGGGSHGGQGHSGKGRYGSARQPVDLGSGGSYSTYSQSGGGAIRLIVSGQLSLEGVISANGGTSFSYPGGAGGSIWVTAGSLAGAGVFTANGGHGGGDQDGGGGRIAVYCDQTTGFTGFAASKATGDSLGQSGTVAFYDRSGGDLTVYHHFIFEGGVTTSYADVTLKAGSTTLMDGMAKVEVANALFVENSAVLWVQSSNYTGQAEGQWLGAGGEIEANVVTVDTGGLITADAQGYASGEGPGADPDNNGGGSHGGEGFEGTGRYGSAMEPVDLGSGGSYSTYSQRGGGALRLVAHNALTLNGEISADGGTSFSYPGGAGGSIWVTAGVLTGDGFFTANGGHGSAERDGGGGRIAVYSDNMSGFTGFTGTTASGDSHAQRGTVAFLSADGQALTVYDHFIFEGDTTTRYEIITLKDGSTSLLNGMGRLEATDTLTLEGQSLLWVLSSNRTGQVEGAWAGQGGTITANNLVMAIDSQITAAARGYVSSQGPGADPDNNGGGSYGGQGNGGTGRYGSAKEPTHLGSGGSYSSYSAPGGGAIRLIVTNNFTLNGEVTADGGYDFSYPGGSGGSIWVTAGSLTGSGKLTADGGHGSANQDGGGGRIAVYSDSMDGFGGFASTTATGDSHAQRGTVAFLNRLGDSLTVYDHFIFEGDTTTGYANVTLRSGATALLNGMGRLQVSGLLELEDATVLQVLSSNRTGRVEGVWRGGGGWIEANNVVVASSAVITADGQGYLSSQGPGADPDNNGGGSHGGQGNGGHGRYGSAMQPIELGSGGSYSTYSAAGGGAIRLVVTNLFDLDGEVTADGNGNLSYPGGAGGSIWVTAGTLSGDGFLTADGGHGSAEQDGGGGRIAVYSDQMNGFTGYTATTATGDSHAQRGTVAFLNRSGDSLTVHDHFIFEGDTTTSYANVSLRSGSTALLNGMGRLQVSGLLDMKENSVLWVLSSNRTGRVEGLWLGEGGVIEVNNLIVASNALITADEQGYLSAQGPGADPDNGGGGSYGGWGNGGTGRYGSAMQPTDLGSGGSYSSYSAPGGGAIRIIVGQTCTLDGEITADGGTNYSYPGGAGGSIWVAAGVLRGDGFLTANGGHGSAEQDGGGGRIAVYSDDMGGFTGFTRTTVNGDSHGQGGTAGFFDQSGTDLVVYDHFLFEPRTNPTFDSVILQPDATMLLYGESLLDVTHEFVVRTNATVWFLSEHRTARVNGEWKGAGASLYAGQLTVDEGGVITATGQGYTSGKGPGADQDNQGGGSYGGRGRYGAAPYGDAEIPVELGSGGSYSTYSANGGGAIRILVSGEFRLDGRLEADGHDNLSYPGGSGGSIWLDAATLSGGGSMSAGGGHGGAEQDGGGGRIAIYAWDQMQLPLSNLAVDGDSHAEEGSVVVSDEMVFRWVRPLGSWLNGREELHWAAAGFDPRGAYAQLTASREGQLYELGLGAASAGSAKWNTSAVPDGYYQVKAVVYSASGLYVGQAVRTLLVNNSVALHEGLIDADETWSRGVVHVIGEDLSIRGGATVTVEAGAVVKIADGVEIVLSNGGSFFANGTAEAPIIFTSQADDSVGGDTNLDGDASVPRPGDWAGFRVEDGTLNLEGEIALLYLQSRHEGTLAINETWDGTYVHHIIDTVTVPDGVTLTIEPGAVVKLDPFKQLIVRSGGQLLALGRPAQPIAFTSIRDDSVGGDLNGDGDETVPAPGDWRGIHVDGGVLELDHASISYAGSGASANTWDYTAAAISTRSTALVTVSNSLIRFPFYEGVIADGGEVTLANAIIYGADRGVNPDYGSTLRLLNCTLDDNRIGIWGHGGSIEMRNTIVSGSIDAGFDNVLGSPVDMTHCNVWSDAGSNYLRITDPTGTDGNISVDPKYRDGAQRNYRLRFESPCIDSGDGLAAPSKDIMGAPRYDDPRTANTGIDDGMGAVPDLGAYEFVEGAHSDLDLVVTEVSGPARVVAGETVEVSWTIRNIGKAVVDGAWHDRISLAPTGAGRWDEVLTAASALSIARLGPNQTAKFTTEVLVPGGTEGEWRWQVKANARGEVFEGLNWNNNTTVSSSPTDMQVPALTVGNSLVDEFRGAGEPMWYKLTLNAGEEVVVQLDTAMAAGRCRMYAGLNAMPNEKFFDVRNPEWNSPDGRLGVAMTGQAGTAYVLIVPEVIQGTDLGFTVGVDAATFALDKVGLNRVGNAGFGTIALHGSQLKPGLRSYLRSSSGQLTEAVQVVVMDRTLALARFDLRGAVPGAYDMVIEDGGLQRSLDDAVTVVAGLGGRLETKVIMPAAVRAGRPFTGYVEYRNAGDGDLPAPLISIRGTSGSVSLWPESGADLDLPSFNALATAVGSPLPGTLPPGGVWRIAFECRVDMTAELKIEVTTFSTQDTRLMDYVALEEQVRPDVPCDLWSEAWTHIATQSGVTRGEYIGTLGAAADRAALFGLQLFSEQDLLTFLLWEARESVKDTVISGVLYRGDTGNPVGRCVLTLTPAGVNVMDPAYEVYQAQTWYDGSFGFVAVPAGVYEVSAKGYLPQSLAVVDLADPVGSPISNLVLTTSGRAGAIQGYVSDGQGGPPIPGLTVEAREEITGEVFYGRTDTYGYYLIHSLPAATYRLSVKAPDRLPTLPRTLPVNEGEVLVESFALSSEGGRIQGVVRSAGGVPTGPSLVTVSYLDAMTDGWSGVTLWTDDSGGFEWVALPPGRYSLGAASNGHAPAQPVVVQIKSAEDRLTTELTLGTAATISGTVVRAIDLSPVEGAQVSIGIPSGLIMGSGASTDASGQFAFPGVGPGAYDVFVAAVGYETTVVRVDAPGDPVSIELAPRGQIFGAVQNGQRRVEGMPVSIVSNTTGTEWTLVTDSSGAYYLDDLFLGTYTLALDALDGQSLARREVVLTSAVPSVRSDFDLNVSVIAGRVLQSDGNTPQTNALVQIYHTGEALGQQWTDDSGAYRFLVRAAGEFNVAASGAGGFSRLSASVTVGVNETMSDQDLLATDQAVQCSVTDPQGIPVAGALVQISGARGSVFDTLAMDRATQSDGTCTLTGVPDGWYRLRVTAPGYALAEQDLEMNSAASVGINLSAARTVSGKVSSGAVVVPGALVAIGNDAYGELFTTLTDEQGEYRFAALPKDVFEISVTRMGPWISGIATNISTVDLAAQTVDVVLEPSLGSVLSGVVTNDLGQSVSGARVVLTAGSGALIDAAVTDADGAYRLSLWPSGGFELQAGLAGHLAGRSSMVLTNDGSSVSVDLGLVGPLVYDTDDLALVPIGGDRSVLGIGDYVPDFLTYSFWRDVLSGDYGLPPPSHYRSQLNADGLSQRYQSYYAGLDKDTRTYCWQVSAAYRDCMAADDRLFDAGMAFDEHYEILKEVNAANVKVVLAQNALLAARLTKLAATIADILKYKPPAGTGRWTPDEITAFSEDINDILNIVGLCRGSLLQGDWKDVGSYLTSIDLALSALKDAGKLKRFVEIAGPINEALAIAWDIQTLAKDYENLDQDARREFQRYQDDVNRYVNAVVALHKAFHKLRAAVNLCQNPPEEPTVDDPPAPPDNEGTGDDEDFIDTPPEEPWTDPPDTWNLPPGPLTPPAPPGPGGQTGSSGSTSVLGSKDPNDKLTIGFGDRGYIGPDTLLHYTIRFENQTNASLPAFLVTVTDSLSTNLDWSTFELGDVRFNNTTVKVPGSLQTFRHPGVTVLSDPNPVTIDAGLDPDTGLISWRMESVDRATGGLPEDPFAGFLPPNTNAPAGEGFVSFYIRPRADAWEGLTFQNTADIVFDYNESILTPPVTNTVDALPPSSWIEPLPAVSPRNFTVRWASSDGQGSGAVAYDVFVSREGGPWMAWLVGTTLTESVFEGEPGVGYFFYSVARDGVGHWEDEPVQYDAETLTEYRLLSVEALTSPGAGDRVRWESATNKVYSVLVSTNLNEGFVPATSGVAATPPENELIVPGDPARERYYLIQQEE